MVKIYQIKSQIEIKIVEIKMIKVNLTKNRVRIVFISMDLILLQTNPILLKLQCLVQHQKEGKRMQKNNRVNKKSRN